MLQLQHSGKARKGDGNDLTPNPRKLQCIGKELDKLGRTINQMTSVNESPFKERPKLRKEKNKLASRACRLKKKAQHEANKIKLYGLETEHSMYKYIWVSIFTLKIRILEMMMMIDIVYGLLLQIHKQFTHKIINFCLFSPYNRTINKWHRRSKESLSL